MGKILVTGGTGYIGSHTAVRLIEAGHDVLIFDNLSNSDIGVLDGIKQITGVMPQFIKGDITSSGDLDSLFETCSDIVAVIHFAALKAVGESVEQPLLYYRNNVGGMINLLEACRRYSVSQFVFSSSCTVYGQPDVLPVHEGCAIRPESPYGYTKRISEEILRHAVEAQPGFRAVSLRYFNPIGAHPSACIGELPRGVPNNLLPFITQTAIGLRHELKVFGRDYNTPDGTCVRDYIDVNDLADAHVKALAYLSNNNSLPYDVFNLGTGTGLSVLQVIGAFQKATSQPLNYSFAPRRAGDVEQVWADATKANSTLGWYAVTSVYDTVKSAWEWEKNYRSRNNKF